jgi:hypothetical protein
MTVRTPVGGSKTWIQEKMNIFVKFKELKENLRCSNGAPE